MEILEETEQFVYYRENGKILGFAVYSNENSKKLFKYNKKITKYSGMNILLFFWKYFNKRTIKKEKKIDLYNNI